MDIGRAFSALTKDPRWKGKIAIGVLISLVPIVNLAVTGWGIRYVAMCARGRDTELPDWNEFGSHWATGLGYSVARLIYYIPAIAILAVMVFPGLMSVGMNTDSFAALEVLLGSLATGLMLAGLFVLVVSLLEQAARVNYAIRGEWAGAFDVKGILAAVKANTGGYVGAWVLSVVTLTGMVLGAGLVGGALNAIPCIGQVVSIVTLPLFMGLGLYTGAVVNAFFGQYAAGAYESTGIAAPIAVPAPQTPSAAPAWTGTPQAPGVAQVRQKLETQPPLLGGQAAVAAAVAQARESRASVVEPSAREPEVALEPPCDSWAESPQETPQETPKEAQSESLEEATAPPAEPLQEHPVSGTVPEEASEVIALPEYSHPVAQTAPVKGKPEQPTNNDARVEQDIPMADVGHGLTSEKPGPAVPSEPPVPPAPPLPPAPPVRPGVPLPAPEAENHSASSDHAAVDSSVTSRAVASPDSPVPPAPSRAQDATAETPRQVANARLRARCGSVAGQSWVIPATPVRAGREESCYVYVDDGKASRTHATLQAVNEGISVDDVGSTNGTFVDGVQISQSTVVRPGSILRIGDIEFEVEAGRRS